ncbi:MAG TPA: 3-dehydroquinate synthase [Polyangiales bacterium]|nr:3-dehydroquinate synthase [Polyangiales bacterium]
MSIQQRFTVAFDYPVLFTEHMLEPGNLTLASALRRREPQRRHRVLCVVDEGVWNAWPDLPAQLEAYGRTHERSLEWAATPLVVPGGEQAKQGSAVVDLVHTRMHALGIDRHAFTLIIGGGAVLDAVGYAAATTHRGVRVIRVPTTVLAQNDAGIGVKNGINAFGAKNFLGSFAPPWAVINDARFLATLPSRDKRAGLAEAVKVALIRDATFFQWLREHAGQLREFQHEALVRSIRRGAELHLQHIAQGGDPFELGSARPLDFGHWAAHKLEGLSSHRLRHGEAVAIGMAIDTRYSVEAGLLSPEDGALILGVLTKLGFRLWDEALELCDARGRPRVLAGLEEFREHLGGDLTVTLLGGVGKSVDVHQMDERHVLAALSFLRNADLRSCA